MMHVIGPYAAGMPVSVVVVHGEACALSPLFVMPFSGVFSPHGYFVFTPDWLVQ